MTTQANTSEEVGHTAVDIVFESASRWFVWTKRGHRPRFVHESETAAINEAIRLSRLNPGIKFHVMRSVCKLSTPSLAKGGK